MSDVESPFAYVQIFEVEPGTQDRFVAKFDEGRPFMEDQPGLRGLSLLKGRDGKTVVVVAEWESDAAPQAMFEYGCSIREGGKRRAYRKGSSFNTAGLSRTRSYANTPARTTKSPTGP